MTKRRSTTTKKIEIMPLKKMLSIMSSLTVMVLMMMTHPSVLVTAFVSPPLQPSFRTTAATTTISVTSSKTRRVKTQVFSSSSSSEEGTAAGLASIVDDTENDPLQECREVTQKGKFDLSTALFCAGLAFDAYVEPPEDSARWEKGSKGMNVAFMSNAYTRNLYKGLLEVTPLKITDLPDEDDAAESLITGNGVDAYLLVAAVEGQWKEDIELIEKNQYHDGVLGLVGAAHVGRSSTAWSNIDEKEATKIKKRRGQGVPYHIKSSWGKGGQAVFMDEKPFYVYVQDPSKVQLVFTVMDEDKIGQDSPIGSAYRKLIDLVPEAGLTGQDLVNKLKSDVLAKIKRGEVTQNDLENDDPNSVRVKFGPKGWKGDIKLTSKPVKKDKNGQIMAATAAGAMIAGPAGAAVGGFMASMYEGEIRGKIELQLRYLPIANTEVERSSYVVKGGLPGIEWGQLYEKYITKTVPDTEALTNVHHSGNDLEHCFFINHDKTGCSCSVYRSLTKKSIVLSFRGTCAPKDILTDASIVQEAWVTGEDIKEKGVAKVHAGFRSSLDSVSRRLKELLLATVAPGDDIAEYDMLVTGHSLGGALSTLFVADIAEFGIDAGRSLPQLAPSEAWWKGIATTFMSKGQEALNRSPPPPPRPKSLRVYNFGSPRVGNDAFCEKFASFLKDGRIDEAYRIVNGDDIIARNPRTMNALAFGSIGYEHCGPTVLISDSPSEDGNGATRLWVEGETDNKSCPVRDGAALKSPLAEGSLLGDIYSATQQTLKGDEDSEKEGGTNDILSFASKIGDAAGKVKDRLSSVSATDLTSVVGIDGDFTQRELKIIQSLMSGDAITQHLEDKYYAGMGRASGFVAVPGEDIAEMSEENA